MCEWRGYLKYVFIFKICIHLSVSDKMTSDKSQEIVSDDFGNFLKTLGSMVYKSKKVAKVEDPRSHRNEYSYPSSSSTPSRTLWRNENNDHRDAFRDMLMLKLVSYYENKYKVNHAELGTNTTPTVPILEDTTINKRRSSNIVKTTERWDNDRNDQNYINNNVVAEVVII